MAGLFHLDFPSADLEPAWIHAGARRRLGAGRGPGSGAAASSSSLMEVEPGCRLLRHTDSAEETLVIASLG